MKTMKKLLCVVLAVVLVCFGFAACSDSTDKKDSDDTATAKVKVIDIELSDEEYAH
ncbi:MAG: hypothetical protein ACLUFN_06030 [Eubacterium sp.]